MFVSRGEFELYTLKASTTGSRKDCLKLVKGLSFSVIAALRALSKDFLEDIRNAILSSELYNMGAKTELE